MVICKLRWLYINILDSVDNDGWLYHNILGSVDNGGWLYRLWIIVVCCELLLSAVIRLFNYSFLYSVSAISPFSLFTKIRKCNSHSSFFILHSSFFFCIKTSRHRVGRVTARYLVDILSFHWPTSTKRQITYIFRKKIPKSFGSSEKSSTFALAFQKTVLLKQINC